MIYQIFLDALAVHRACRKWAAQACTCLACKPFLACGQRSKIWKYEQRSYCARVFWACGCRHDFGLGLEEDCAAEPPAQIVLNYNDRIVSTLEGLKVPSANDRIRVMVGLWVQFHAR